MKGHKETEEAMRPNNRLEATAHLRFAAPQARRYAYERLEQLSMMCESIDYHQCKGEVRYAEP